jgi:hypothetical protein
VSPPLRQLRSNRDLKGSGERIVSNRDIAKEAEMQIVSADLHARQQTISMLDNDTGDRKP